MQRNRLDLGASNVVVLWSQVLCVCLRNYWLRCWLSLSAKFGVFSPQLEKPHQYGILFLSQLFDGAPARFAHYSIDDGLLQLGRDVWSSKRLDHALEWIHEVLDEVSDTARA